MRELEHLKRSTTFKFYRLSGERDPDSEKAAGLSARTNASEKHALGEGTVMGPC